MALAHILFGTAVKQHGNLLFTAKAAGKRGEQLLISIAEGSPLAVTVDFKGAGTEAAAVGTIAITAPAGTTEQQLLTALTASANFRALARVELTGGDGTAVVAPLAQSPLVASGGLRQHLQAKTGIGWWEDRDQKSTGKVNGFISIDTVKSDRIEPPDPETDDVFTGVVNFGVYFQGLGFEAQYATLDQMRRALYLAVKSFSHEELADKGPYEFSYSNALTQESTGTKRDEADLGVILKLPVRFTEPSTEEAFTIQSINPGLWLEPLTDPLGPGGGEVLDTTLTIEE
jgi:hypothetical protein